MELLVVNSANHTNWLVHGRRGVIPRDRGWRLGLGLGLLVGLVGYLASSGHQHYRQSEADHEASSASVAAQLESIFEERLPAKFRGQSAALSQHLLQVSRQFGMDPFLVLAVIHAESSFRPQAKSRVGALGLMQLRPLTAAYIAEKQGLTYAGSEDLLDPAKNITLGIAYLNYLREKFPDKPSMLVAYNYGPTSMRRRQAKMGPKFEHQGTYVTKIKETRQLFAQR